MDSVIRIIMQVLVVFTLVAPGFCALDERELRKLKLDKSVYDPGVIPGVWRKENMNDFKNLGDFVSSKCSIYPDLKWEMAPGTIEDTHHFSSDRIVHWLLFFFT